MTEQEFKKQLKQGEVSGLYLLTGEELYLRDHYADQVIRTVVDPAFADFNAHIYDERNFSTQEILDAVMAYPMMAEKKIIVFKEVGLLSKGEPEKEFFASLFSDLPEDCVMLLCESQVDKLYAPYKAVQKYGTAVSFSYRNRNELKAWLSKALLRYQKTISDTDLLYLIDHCGPSMTALRTEFEKVVSFIGNRTSITRSDIDQTVQFSDEYKMYVLTDAIFAEKGKDVYTVLNDMKRQKESAVMLVSMIGRFYGDLLKANLMLSEGASVSSIVAQLSGPEFARRKSVDMARKADAAYLKDAVHALWDADRAIKSGEMEEWMALSVAVQKIIITPIRDR